MGRGGRRPGAGRPQGARNKRTQRVLEAAAASGLTPAELLLRMARGESTPGIPKPTREEIMDARKAAAPYYNPRLSAFAMKPEDPTNPWTDIFAFADGKSRGLPNGTPRKD